MVDIFRPCFASTAASLMKLGLYIVSTTSEHAKNTKHEHHVGSTSKDGMDGNDWA